MLTVPFLVVWDWVRNMDVYRRQTLSEVVVGLAGIAYFTVVILLLIREVHLL